MNCPFCNINTEISRIVLQTDLVVGMLSNPRLVPGHLLVMPKRHVEKPWEMNFEEMGAIYHEVLTYQQFIVESGIAPGCDVRQNYRPFIVQGRLKVNHVHFHILPRWPGEQDELYQRSMKFEAGIFKDLPEDERKKYAALYDFQNSPPS